MNDVPDAEVQATIDHARAAIETHRSRLSATRPATSPPQQDRNKQLWASAMIDTLKQMGLPNSNSPGG